MGAADAATVHAVVHAAFEARPAARPAGGRARRDRRAARGSGWPCTADCWPGSTASRPARWCSTPSAAPCTCAASASCPDQQGHGVAAALIDAAVEAADGYDDLTVVAREELPATIRFWERQGFHEIRRYSPNVELRRPLRTAVYQAPDADAMRGLGRSLAGQLAPGDLIVLTGVARGRQDDVHPGPRRRARRPRARSRRRRSSSRACTRARSAARRWSTPTPTGSVASTSSTTSTSTPRSTGPSPSWSGARGWPRGCPSRGCEVKIVRGGDEDEHRRVEITPVGPRWHALSFRGLG